MSDRSFRHDPRVGFYPIAGDSIGWQIESGKGARAIGKAHHHFMHHLHSIAAVMRFRLAALLLCVSCLIAPVAVGLLIESTMTHDPRLTLVGSGLMLFCLVLVISQWAAASRARCPLCVIAVLAPKACVKHRHAKTLMGSHRLRVALTILFKNRFRCPYCNEATGLDLRHPLHRGCP